MISIFEQFFTKSRALAFLRDYRKQFPGKTFGTNIRLGFDRLEQCWKVTGHRFNLNSNQRGAQRLIAA